MGGHAPPIMPEAPVTLVILRARVQPTSATIAPARAVFVDLDPKAGIGAALDSGPSASRTTFSAHDSVYQKGVQQAMITLILIDLFVESLKRARRQIIPELIAWAR